MFDSSTIDKENLDLAANQLWQILKPEVAYLSDGEQKVVELAFLTMVDSHDQQRRKSGEFYIIHPVSACLILTRLKIDKDTLAACLMHDVPEDTSTNLKDLSKIFSNDIVFLVEGVTKLSKIKYLGNTEYIDNLQRMFVAMSKDLRVILIKLADRLHNLRTLHYVKPEKQRRIALESVEVYAPIAERLGISFFRGEIEDAAFPYLHPNEYKDYISRSNIVIEKRARKLVKIEAKTKSLLQKSDLHDFNLVSRAKRYYSIYKKAIEKSRPIEDIYDLMALRIITNSVEDCYTALSALHHDFNPLESRLKDYIKAPKPNGYQSIHTTVQDPDNNLVFECQIRTQEMHDYAEYGVAAHWTYKNKKDFLKRGNMEWLGELLKLGSEDWSDHEYLKYMKLDLFQDRIFVMTPKGDPINLPEGATVLDFAFRIHDEVGSKAVMAKINSKTVPLCTVLTNADTVEIITSKNQKPSRDWLQIVQTANAARHIRSILRKKGEFFPDVSKKLKLPRR
jgi:GTP diphosphokinase / guanosine-3',5'-bis(diphosphate) 3'-diphosphatase